jgi:hypothetical protein
MNVHQDDRPIACGGEKLNRSTSRAWQIFRRRDDFRENAGPMAIRAFSVSNSNSRNGSNGICNVRIPLYPPFSHRQQIPHAAQN